MIVKVKTNNEMSIPLTFHVLKKCCFDFSPFLPEGYFHFISNFPKFGVGFVIAESAILNLPFLLLHS
jgi:hypothetical protein